MNTLRKLNESIFKNIGADTKKDAEEIFKKLTGLTSRPNRSEWDGQIMRIIYDGCYDIVIPREAFIDGVIPPFVRLVYNVNPTSTGDIKILIGGMGYRGTPGETQIQSLDGVEVNGRVNMVNMHVYGCDIKSRDILNTILWKGSYKIPRVYTISASGMKDVSGFNGMSPDTLYIGEDMPKGCLADMFKVMPRATTANINVDSYDITPEDWKTICKWSSAGNEGLYVSARDCSVFDPPSRLTYPDRTSFNLDMTTCEHIDFNKIYLPPRMRSIVAPNKFTDKIKSRWYALWDGKKDTLEPVLCQRQIRF